MDKPLLAEKSEAAKWMGKDQTVVLDDCLEQKSRELIMDALARMVLEQVLLSQIKNYLSHLSYEPLGMKASNHQDDRLTQLFSFHEAKQAPKSAALLMFFTAPRLGNCKNSYAVSPWSKDLEKHTDRHVKADLGSPTKGFCPGLFSRPNSPSDYTSAPALSGLAGLAPDPTNFAQKHYDSKIIYIYCCRLSTTYAVSPLLASHPDFFFEYSQGVTNTLPTLYSF